MRTAHAVVMALLGLTGAEELTQQVDQQISAEDNQLCENEFMELDDESLAELDKASYQNHAKIAAENKKILATEKMCSKWVQTHKRHNVICKCCSKTVKPSTHWKFYKNVWYRWEGGKWHYWGPSRGGYGGAWRWSGGYWHHGGFAYKYVNGHWYRFYNHKWHYYKKMIPINPQRPRTPVTCVHVMQMVKAGIPDSLTAHSVSRCQVGRSIYMYDGRACKILGGRKVSQKLAKCKSGYAHKWRKVKRCTGGDLYKPMAPREILNVRWGRIAGSANDIGFGGGKIWVIGNNREGGGYGIYRRDGSRWTKIAGSATRIAVKPDGNAMVTNKQAGIYDYTGKKMEQMARSCLGYRCFIQGQGLGHRNQQRGWRIRHLQKRWQQMDQDRRICSQDCRQRQRQCLGCQQVQQHLRVRRKEMASQTRQGHRCRCLRQRCHGHWN